MTTMEITRKIGAPLSKASAEFVKSHIDEANAEALEGYVLCVANHMEVCDSDMDIVKSTAWDASLQALKAGDAGIAVLYGHDAAGGVVGKVVDGFVLGLEDKTSVLVLELKLNMDKEIGRDCFSDVAGGFLRELSVGFNIPHVEGATKRVKVGSDYAQEIFLADLVEVSFVIRGSSPNTRIIETKEDKEQIGRDRFTTAKEAAQRGEALGCGSTAHEHRDPDTGEVYYMPCPDMAVYRSTDAMRGESPITYSTDTETAKNHTETAAASAIEALAARMLASAMLKRLKNQKNQKENN